MQREHRVQSGTGVCQESKTCPWDSWIVVGNTSSQTGFKATLFKKTSEINGETEYAIAYAGTDFHFNNVCETLEAVKDIAADIQNYLGIGLSLQQLQAIKYAIANTSKKEHMTFVGHSLGGGLAALVSMITGKDAITFNPASINGVAKFIGNIMHRGGNITQYRTVGKSLFNTPIRVGGDYVNLFQSITSHPSQGSVHPVYLNRYKYSHSIEDIIKIFSR